MTQGSHENAIVAIYDSQANAQNGIKALEKVGLTGEILSTAQGATLGGAAGAIATALQAIGIPPFNVAAYELEAKRGKLVVLARGSAEAIDRAFTALGGTGALDVTAHGGASQPPRAAAGYIARASVLALLADDEVAKVSNAESAPYLADGDEYLDLEHLDQGVQRASGKIDVARLLTRKGVHQATWTKILAELAAYPAPAQR